MGLRFSRDSDRENSPNEAEAKLPQVGVVGLVPSINEDTPLRLAKALELAFPHGGMTVNGLRTEMRNGNLAIEVIAGKQFTTLNHIKEMRAKCRENRKVPASTGASLVQADQGNGLSSTERQSAAQDAARMIAQKLRSSSRAT